MARKKKIINNTPYPQHAIDAVARCLWPDIVAFFESEEGQKEFEAWKRQQDKERVEQENQLKGSIRKNSVRVSDETLAEFFRYGGLSCSALGRSPPPSAVFKIIVVEGKKKSEPISDLENLVRIICFWLPR